MSISSLSFLCPPRFSFSLFLIVPRETIEAIRKDSAITKSSSDILFSLVFNETRVKGEATRRPFQFVTNKRERNFATLRVSTNRYALCTRAHALTLRFTGRPKRFVAFKGFCVWLRETRHHRARKTRNLSLASSLLLPSCSVHEPSMHAQTSALSFRPPL